MVTRDFVVIDIIAGKISRVANNFAGTVFVYNPVGYRRGCNDKGTTVLLAKTILEDRAVQGTEEP